MAHRNLRPPLPVRQEERRVSPDPAARGVFRGEGCSSGRAPARGRQGSRTTTGGFHLVTGSSGFIGSHLCEALCNGLSSGRGVIGVDLVRPESPVPYRFVRADIRSPGALRRVHRACRPGVLLHLAALAEVVTPLEELPDLVTTNIAGTLNILLSIRPRLVVLASSCAVYGNSRMARADPEGGDARPLGMYGMSKASAELVCREWARQTGGVALCLRLGNVVGRGCRGLIPYLVRHALQDPAGRTPARLRGEGRLVRDYVPVAHAVRVLNEMTRLRWAPGTCLTLNVGSGRGLSNGAVARIVQQVLRRKGYRIALTFSEPRFPGEAEHVVLDAQDLRRRFGFRPPPPAVVIRSIEEATLAHLEENA